MPYGWTGIILEVNLTQQSIKKTRTDPQLVRSFLGGKGLGAKIMWDRVPPETQPFSPDNLVIITPGLLVGTPVPFANRAVFTFISPVTELYRHSSMGGYWANELKHAGYDGIIISGKSVTPVYLWINDDKVELRDASHLWGKGTYATHRLLCQELKNQNIEVASIGQAGENKVYMAAVYGGTGASASRGGLGALWGDKKLKAIAVYGNQDINLAHPAKLIELSNQILQRSEKMAQQRGQGADPSYPDTYLTGLNRFETRDTWYGYYNEQGYEALLPGSELKREADSIDERLKDLLIRRGTKGMACHNCRVHCRMAATGPNGALVFLKCITLFHAIVSAKYFNYDWALDTYAKIDDWGLDCSAFPRAIAFAIDLYQRGILTKEDTDGLHLEFGNPEVFDTLMEKTVRREGIGDILADGPHFAARRIGRGAEELVVTNKGLEPTNPSRQHYIPYMALGLAVEDKQLTGGQQAGEGWSKMRMNREEKEAAVKAGECPYPEEYEKYWLSEPNYDGRNYEALCQLMSYDQDRFALTESLGLCHFTTRGLPMNHHKHYLPLVTNATGFDIDEKELMTTANRIVNIIKALNLRRGLRRKDDIPPKIFFEREAMLPRQKIDPGLFNKWLDRFYELRGWDKEGVPTRDTLEKCDLDYVRQNLEARRILVEKKALAITG